MRTRGESKLYSYVVEHDTGRAPNPYFGVCTLCSCKRRKSAAKPKNVIELAKKGDWVVGTGGVNLRKSAGHGKLVYAMKVDEKLTREDYYTDPRFPGRWDNLPPKGNFEKQKQFVLVSRHFWYFGAKAKKIPKKFLNLGLEKKGPGFRSDFAPEVIGRFVRWLKNRCKPGKHGDPCMRPTDKSEGSKRCKSSC